MYEITWEDIKNTAIELIDDLDEFTPAQQKLVLDTATRRVPEARFNADTFDARRYYAAHLAAIAITPPAGEGTRSSESIDSFSTGVTLAVNNPTAKQNFLETVYGRVYWNILETNYQPFFVG